MTIRQQCEQDYAFNPDATLPFNMLVGVFGLMTWANADREDYAEMRSILTDMLNAIDEVEAEENEDD